MAGAAAAASTASLAAAAGDPVPARGLPLPPEGRWRFGVYYGEYERRLRVASLDFSIEIDPQGYVIASAGRAEGVVAMVWSGVLSQRSEGALTPAGLVPRRYWERRGKRPERWAEIDARRREVAFSGSEPVPLVDGLQDRLSVLVQLGLMARANPDRFAAGREIEIPELHSRRIERSRYLSRGAVSLKAAGSGRRALHLERTGPYDADDARIDLWLGYDLQLLPIRLRLSDPDGRVLDQLLDFS